MAEQNTTTPLDNALNGKLQEREVHNTQQTPPPAPVAPVESAKSAPADKKDAKKGRPAKAAKPADREKSAPAAEPESAQAEVQDTVDDIDAQIADLERRKAAINPLKLRKEKSIREIYSKCINCGHELDEEGECSNCGYDLKRVNNVLLDNERIKEITS